MSKDQAKSPAGDLLIIGYGNTLRSDDGVGVKVAEAVEALHLSGVAVLACHQLTPELAEPISTARAAVFVDAAADASTEVQLRQLAPADGAQLMAHAADPRSLLALAQRLFGRCPPAWWLTIPIENVGFGDDLSPIAQRGFEKAMREIKMLCSS